MSRNLDAFAERFGQSYGWDLDDGRRLDISDALSSVGPGRGFAMMPLALDRYEVALGISIKAMWLLKRLLPYAWEYRQDVYPSFRKISAESGHSQGAVYAARNELVECRYLKQMSRGRGLDRRIRYDVSPALAALAICTAYDPLSKWSLEHGGPIGAEEAETLSRRYPRLNIPKIDMMVHGRGYGSREEAYAARASEAQRADVSGV